MNQIVCDLVVPALPHHYGRGRSIDFSGVMNPVVADHIILAHILGSRAVASEQHGHPPQMREFTIGHDIAFATQIEPQSGSTGRGETAGFDGTMSSSAKPHCASRAV